MSLPPRRAVAFVIVLALHAVGLLVLIEFRAENIAPAANDFISTLILLPAGPAPADKRQSPLVDTRIHSVPLDPLIPDSVESPPDTAGPAIDWAVEAQREGAAITDPPKAREFGQNLHADREKITLQSTPAHYAGEQYWTNSANQSYG